MVLDPRARQLLQQAAAIPAAPLNALTPKRARARMNASSTTLGEPEPVARVEDGTVEGEDGRPIPVRIYGPDGSSPSPGIVYLHGGGWVTGSIKTHDHLCRALANAAKARVISVEYRLAPESRFPAPVHDAYDVTAWAVRNAADLGVEGLAIAGDSAGGNLAAAACLMARDRGGPRIDRQILIYPITNHGFDTASYHQNAEGYLLGRDDMIWFWGHYLEKPEDGAHPYASPLRVRDLGGLPPALVVTAQYDPLKDEGDAYATRLMQAGVPTVHLGYDGMIHGFIRRLNLFPQARHVLEEIAGFLRQPSEILAGAR